jgi:hypothetical protein
VNALAYLLARSTAAAPRPSVTRKASTFDVESAVTLDVRTSRAARTPSNPPAPTAIVATGSVCAIWAWVES